MYLVREGIGRSPVGQFVESQRERAVGAVAGRFEELPGYSSADAGKGATGVVGVSALTLFGAGGLLKRLPMVDRSLARLPRTQLPEGTRLHGAGLPPKDLESNALVPFNGRAATETLLGTSTTPSGRLINFHAAERMVDPPKGRLPMSPHEVDQVLDGATRVVRRSYHPQGETLTIENSNMAGGPRVVVDEATGQRIITVINPKPKKGK